MSQTPKPYNRVNPFGAASSNNPSNPIQGTKLDAEFNAVEVSLDQTQARLAEIQRDDGKLRNESVGQDQMAPALMDYIKSETQVITDQAVVARNEAEGFANAAEASADDAAESAAASEASAVDSEINAELAALSGARFCGVLAVAPTTRVNGSPLQQGDEYHNTVDHMRYNWTGVAWVALNSSAQSLETRLADPVYGSDMVQYLLKNFADAVPCDVSERLDQRLYFWNFLTPNQRNNVTADLGTMDLTAAWDKMLASLKKPGTFVYPITPLVQFPVGTIYFATEKVVSQKIHIVGEGSGQSGGDYGTTIKFPADCSGFIFKKANTGPNENGSDSSIIERMFIQGGGIDAGARTKHGIDMQARIQVKNVTCNGFSGNGINIVAAASVRKNANLWVLDTVKLRGNGMHGLYVSGADANAGIATMVDASNNNRSGIYDDSFLGNTYIACHTSANGKKGQVHYEGNRYYCASDTLGGSTVPGTNSAVWILIGAGSVHPVYPTWVSGGEYYIGYAYRFTNDSAHTVIVSCYFESGQPNAQVKHPAVVIGGLISAEGNRTPDSTAMFLTNGGRVTDLDNRSHGADYHFSFGSKSVKASFGLFAATDVSNGLTQQWDAAAGIWVWKWANATELSYMTTFATTVAAGRSAPLGGGIFGLPKPFVMGSGSLQRMFGRATWTSGFPTSGEYARGDTYIGGSHSPAGKAGTLCTTGGAAGVTAVFKFWGTIDA